MTEAEQLFEKMIAEEHEIRTRQEREQMHLRKITGENQYTDFCLWCNAFNKGQGKNDNQTFKRYMQEQNITLNFWQKKHLAEKYFGYEYKFDNDSRKWFIMKKVS